MGQNTGASGHDGRQAVRLHNDTIINVAQLMKDDVGSRRDFEVTLDTLALDDDLMAKDVTADVRLTRITRGVLASGHVKGTAIVQCHRCLNDYEQPFASDFDQEYRPLIDVRSGLLVDQPRPDEELGSIDEAHELDVAEPMRQVAIVDLPIKQLCGEDCPGLADEYEADEGEPIDRRLSALSALLDGDSDDESDQP